MNKIQEIKDKVKEIKYKYVYLQKFDIAYNWREVERNLIKVIEGDSLILFIEKFKNSNYINFYEMYDVIKPLDRKEKLSKIEKLYNNK